MPEQSISKSEFARRRNVSPARVTQWIDEGKITGAALDGEGREQKVFESVAVQQLLERLDPMQRMGNGLTTNLQPVPPAADLDLAMIAEAEAGSPPPTAQPTGSVLRPVADPLDAELKQSRLEQLQRANRKAARDEAEEAGQLTAAGLARAQYGRIGAQMLNVYEGSLTQIASAIAARFELEKRDVLHELRQQFRAVRATAASTLRQQLASIDPTIAVEIGTDASQAEADHAIAPPAQTLIAAE